MAKYTCECCGETGDADAIGTCGICLAMVCDPCNPGEGCHMCSRYRAPIPVLRELRKLWRHITTWERVAYVAMAFYVLMFMFFLGATVLPE